eukprot:31373-Pleurochrysis_carterae.AAC.1
MTERKRGGEVQRAKGEERKPARACVQCKYAKDLTRASSSRSSSSILAAKIANRAGSAEALALNVPELFSTVKHDPSSLEVKCKQQT